jgi:CHASE3 domain sensor protein
MPGTHLSKKARSYFIAALTFPCLVIAGAWYLAYNSIHQLDDAIGLVDHTFAVRMQINHLRQLLVDAETGERGFLLTSNRIFLEPYLDAIADIPSQIQNLAALTQLDLKQQKLVDEIKAVSREKLDWMAQSIAREESGAHAEVTRMMGTGQAKMIMDRLRELLATMEAEESSLFAVHQQQLRNHANARTHLLLFLLIMNVFFAIGIYYTMDRLRRLQGFVKMCAWSRTIEFDGEWMSFEAYLYKRFGLETSHGMSPQELDRFEEGLSSGRGTDPKK